MENKKWDLVALASIPLIMTLGNSMLIPILPQISKALGISSFKVSMLITVYAVVAILLIPIAGIVFGSISNKGTISDVAEAGKMLYKKRRLNYRLRNMEHPL